MNIWRFPYYIHKPSLIPIRLHNLKETISFFQPYNLTSDDLSPCCMTSDFMIIWRFPHYINKPILVAIRFPTFQMRWILHFQPILQLDLRWPLTSSTNEGSHVASMTQLRLKSMKACGRQSQMLPCFPNNRQQWTKRSLCVFPGKAGNTKTKQPPPNKSEKPKKKNVKLVHYKSLN